MTVIFVVLLYTFIFFFNYFVVLPVMMNNNFHYGYRRYQQPGYFYLYTLPATPRNITSKHTKATLLPISRCDCQ